VHQVVTVDDALDMLARLRVDGLDAQRLGGEGLELSVESDGLRVLTHALEAMPRIPPTPYVAFRACPRLG